MSSSTFFKIQQQSDYCCGYCEILNTQYSEIFTNFWQRFLAIFFLLPKIFLCPKIYFCDKLYILCIYALQYYIFLPKFGNYNFCQNIEKFCEIFERF